jgi:PAS domain S-box-containing protein
MHSYLLFHGLAEIASATISFGTFLFAWNTRRFQNPYLTSLGIASLFVGVFEALHCLAFPGMPVFPGYDSNLSPQLWLSARLLQSCSSLTGLLLMRRPPRSPWVLTGGFAAAFVVLCSAVFLRMVPAVVTPTGLTPFKIAAELILAAVFLGSVALLFRVRDAFSPRVFRFLIAQGIAMAGCEICFTLYAQPYDFSNLLGHVLLLTGGTLQYMAILRAGLLDPGETHFRELTHAKERLELAQSAGRIGTFEWDLTPRGVVALSGMETVFGESRVAGDLETWRDRLYPEDRERVDKLLADVVEGRSEYDTEYRVLWPDGSVHWVGARGRLQRDDQGRPARLVGVNMEISERKQGEEALRGSEERLRLFIEHAPASLAMFDRDMRYLSASRRWLAQYRLGETDLRGRSHYEIFPEISEEWKRVHRRGLQGEVAQSEEDRFVRADGTVHWLRWEVRPWRDAGGGIGGIVIFSEDITERKRAERALRESEHRFRLALRNAPVSVAAQDRELRYIWAYNQNAAVPGGIEGKLDSDVFAPEVAARMVAIKRRVLAENIELREQMWMDSPVGRSFLDICFEPIMDHDGDVIGVGTAAVDLTPMKEAEALQRALLDEREKLLESERSARGEVERASRLKDEFLANLSHELRTPLNAILGWTQILSRGKADPGTMGKGLEVIERNARIQTRLISDLLDVSRIISGKTRLEIEDVDPVSALDAAIDSIAPAAEAKTIRIEKVIHAPRLIISGDASRLQQIFWNLLSNAVKFTAAGGQIQVVQNKRESWIEMQFRDTGKGLSPDFIPHVFERFRQSDASPSRRHAGLGLGLAIVKHLVELHGGTVEAESPGEGRGATFTVLLPLGRKDRRDAIGARSAEAGRPTSSSLTGKRILFVDDDSETRDLVYRLLTAHGAIVSLADSAAAAVSLVQELRPDVLLADIGMPGEDGYQMIRRIRALSSQDGGQTPAIALTAYSRAEDRTNALDAGFQHHIAKPVDAAELVAALGMVFRRFPVSSGS